VSFPGWESTGRTYLQPRAYDGIVAVGGDFNPRHIERVVFLWWRASLGDGRGERGRSVTAYTGESDLPTDMRVVAVAECLWAVYDFRVCADVAVGHIERHCNRYHVGLQGDELEMYFFDTLENSIGWFTEYCFAMTLGTADAAAASGYQHRDAA
jgi:hypothetical protein